ncbi:amylo-alpha-1,6-glucosidase [Flammeovirgaceae bacterium SG7u.111]|nr:amylo-alpha-1,6-glucosidase [Flammeovirgaceae bacterium SG7u.132]WPO36366.1 amylo-alpha-1,6-glucosidase [Flammeovirgaceae bacterium SG7u.111]
MTNTVENQPKHSKKEWAFDPGYIDDRVQVLNHCGTFGIFSRMGDILPLGKAVHGLYHKDTRYINTLALKLEGEALTLLSSNIKEENEILSVDLTNPDLLLADGTFLRNGTAHIRRSQFVRNGVYLEKIELQNFGEIAVSLKLSLTFSGDFKDIFEVRGLKREKRGMLDSNKQIGNKQVVICYHGLDNISRKANISFGQEFHQFEGEEVYFDLCLPPKQTIALDYSIAFEEGEGNFETKVYQHLRPQVEPSLEENKSYFPTIETSNEQFSHWLNRSKSDLISLMADTPFGKYPYAGVPWYNTAFGRDGIITALETLWVAPDLSRDTLLYLAACQSDKLDEENDAEPGKILHETRGGEMVNLNEVPFRQYYGTIDATPLFVMLAGEYYQRTADLGTLKKIWSNIKKALEWINLYGDLDQDGFVEYKHKAKNGLTNQGWKDSHDSVSHSNGQLADPPIALCEVQGYVYAAKIHGANLAKTFGEHALANQWRDEAKRLKEKFNERFWDKELNCYVLALDGNKQPCRVKSSNAGHVLYTGIADPSKAKALAATLLKPDMFNGWGIRTLSSDEVRYNPMSYHNGSVWPHDVALIASGLSRYGFQQQALRLMTGLFDASLFIPLQRLPELFCGMERRKGEGPTSYPVACSPQAWSVAAVFMLLKAVLQIKISPLTKEISFQKPILPSYLEEITIKNLLVGNGFVNLHLVRHNHDQMVGVNWENSPEGWKLTVVK